MAFGHGKDCDVYLNGRNLSPFLQRASLSHSGEASETTTMGKSSKTFIAGLKGFSVSAEGFFDSVAGGVDDVFSNALGRAAVSLLTIYPVGETAIGDFGYSGRCRGVSHGIPVEVAGIVGIESEFTGDDDLERCIALHVLGAETSASNGSSVDNAAQTTAGAAAYLHVTAFSGTSITVKVQDSADNSAWADVTGLTFTAATAAGTSERVATAITATIRRYVRASWSGTFTSATFALAFNRK